MTIHNKNKRGFTLVEMIVSIGLFTIVLFIATNAFLTIVNADRKSRSVRVATDNLNLTLEDMSRRIKTGSMYFCGTASAGVNDCALGGTTFSFTGQDGLRAIYSFNTTEHSIHREISGGASMRVTSPEITITGLKFIVQGSALGPSAGGSDYNQPYVVILVDGKLSAGPSASNTTFKIQTAVTQRAYDN
jgi:prepilin-type N-terminal cleavage/methylation domain-containing protein